jgi:hypothetical protein
MPQFLIWSEEHRAWWRPMSRGYTDSIRDAGRYSEEQAKRICKDANFGGTFHELAVPLPVGIPPAR